MLCRNNQVAPWVGFLTANGLHCFQTLRVKGKISVQFEVFPGHIKFGKIHVQNKHFFFCNLNTINAHSN